MVQPAPSSADRRPIAARSWSVSQRLAHALAAARITPNQISIAGMLCGIAAGAALAATAQAVHPRPLWVAAAALIQLRLLANMLDGMVALETGTASPLGELYNDVPDRVSDAAALIGLGYAAGGAPELGYAAAILAVLTAYVRAVGKAAGAPSDFRGPMAKQQRMFLVTVLSLYAAAAPAAWTFVWGPRQAWGPSAAVLAFIAFGCIVTCLRRLTGIAAQLRGTPRG